MKRKIIEKKYLIKTYAGNYEKDTLEEAISMVKFYINNINWCMCGAGGEVKIYPIVRETTIKERIGKCIKIIKDKEGKKWK